MSVTITARGHGGRKNRRHCHPQRCYHHHRDRDSIFLQLLTSLIRFAVFQLSFSLSYIFFFLPHAFSTTESNTLSIPRNLIQAYILYWWKKKKKPRLKFLLRHSCQFVRSYCNNHIMPFFEIACRCISTLTFSRIQNERSRTHVRAVCLESYRFS